jgi:hypothetical protein
MAIKIIGGNISGNGGDGIRIEGDVDLEASGVNIENNGGRGVNIIKHAGIMQQFGLPVDTDPGELANLLIAIKSAPSEKSKVITESNLWGKFSTGVLNSTTLVSNLINFTNSPQCMQLIATLLK